MTTPNVVAALVVAIDAAGLNGCTQIPKDATLPIVRVEEAGGPDESSQAPNWLIRQSLQVDVWGATKADAWGRYAAVRDLLLELPVAQPGVVLNRIAVGAPSWIPDSDWTSSSGRPMPRYLSYVRVTARPTN